MNITARQKGFRRRGRLLLCLILGLTLLAASASSPQALASQATRLSVTQAVTQEVLLPGLEMKPIPAPETLQAFTRQTISQLSADAPFKEWKDAVTEVYPLGPGTRSWLVNVMHSGQRIGYLIISAADQGGYLLSEYGAGTDGLLTV